jgi:hypothetical protein
MVARGVSPVTRGQSALWSTGAQEPDFTFGAGPRAAWGATSIDTLPFGSVLRHAVAFET